MSQDDFLDNSITTSNLSVSSETELDGSTELSFCTKGLHISNLNVRHLIPKLDELRITMAEDKSPDILGICETFLSGSVSDDLLAIDGLTYFEKIDLMYRIRVVGE